MKEFLKKHKYTIIAFAIVFIIAFLFPYTGDDFEWGAYEISLKEFMNVFKNPNINGRYLGNIFVMFMAKYRLVRALVMATVLVAMMNLIKKDMNVPGYAVWLLFLVIPIEIARQSVVWTSGFTNYVISTLFLLVDLKMLSKSFVEEKNVKLSFLNFFLFIASCLFIENMTIFLLLLTLGLNIFYFIKHKKVNLPLAMSFIGSLAGTILMFIQPAYHNVLTGDDIYRNMGAGLRGKVYNMAYNFVFFMQKYALLENCVLVTALTLCLRTFYKKSKRVYSKLQKKTINGIFAFMFIYSFYSVLLGINSEWLIIGSKSYIVNAFLSAIFLVVLFIQMWLVFGKEKDFLELCAPLLVIVGLMLPLIIVNPIGPRNFFPIYILEMIEVVLLLKKCDFDFEKYSKYGVIAICLLAVQYASIYAQVAYVDYKRNDYISDMNKNTDEVLISVPLLPYKEFVYDANFIREYQLEKYKCKFGIRNDLYFKFIDYEDWVEELEEIEKKDKS